MLGILWLILKIILIVLGVILGMAIVILTALLFAPFKYNAFARKNGDIDVNGRVSWLFGILRAEYMYNGEDSGLVLKYPFSSRINKRKEEEQTVFAQQLEEVKQERKQEPKSEDYKPYEVSEEAEPNYTEENSYSEHGEKTYTNEKSGVSEKIKIRLTGIYNGLRDFAANIKGYADSIQSLNEKYDLRAVIVRTLRLVKKLFKNTGFKVFEINGIIGFEDPSLTGKLLGIKSAAECIIPVNMNIDGDFNEKRLEGSAALSGRTNLFRILFPIAIYILRKPIRPIVIDYVRGEK